MVYDGNKIAAKIAMRLKSPRLTPFTSHMSDFSRVSMVDRMCKSISNLENARQYMSQLNLGQGDGIYSLDMSMRNNDAANSKDFSAGAGASGFEGVRGVDVIDLTLIATVQSMIPTMAVDFGMQKPTDVITYQKLVAVNAHGQVAAGESVVNPYRPLNYKAASSTKSTTLTAENFADTTTVPASTFSSDFGAPVSPGTVKVVLKSGTVGEDVKRDGQIYFLGASTLTAEVDYATGIITIGGTYTSLTDTTYSSLISAMTANPDMSSETDGANTLRLEPRPEKITVEAKQHSVQLQNNIESISFMNKQVTGKNYGEIATRQMLDAFIYTLNTEVAQTVIDLVNKLEALDSAERLHIPAVTPLDLSSYYSGDFTQFSITKDDRVIDYLNRIELTMTERSDKTYTFILCGNIAARVFMSNPKFKAIPQQLSKMDGVMGYLDLGYAQIAIVKHQVMNARDRAGTANVGKFILGYKDPDGFAAPVGYFEYLPICSTKVALNWLNPTQFSQSVFNYSESDSLIKEYIYEGAFKIA